MVSCSQNKPKNHNNDVDTAAVGSKASADTTILKSPDNLQIDSATTSSPANPIDAIRRMVESINNMKLEQKHFEFMCDEKMLVDYYYNNLKLVKIHVDYGTIGDVYAREDYYYNNGKLIFNYEFVEGGPACEGCIKKNEYRSYIKDDKVIKYLKDKTVEQCRKCEFGPSSKQYKLLTAKNQAQVKAILCR